VKIDKTESKINADSHPKCYFLQQIWHRMNFCFYM